jgi:hypothetical protein
MSSKDANVRPPPATAIATSSIRLHLRPWFDDRSSVTAPSTGIAAYSTVVYSLCRAVRVDGSFG